MCDGVVVIDKPSGMTSHDVVYRVKRIFSAKKAGHTGTLDPLATGVLPICLNAATKLSDKLMSGDKEYDVEILLGTATTTYDIEGEITEQRPIPTDLKERLSELIPEFTGIIEQAPPHYSAVKHKGQPLYKWARKGIFIDLPARPVEIKRFKIKGYGEDTILANILCSKGTYIRSICHDLGARLGSGACMKGLRRVATGPFNIIDAVSLDELEGIKDPKLLRQKLIFCKLVDGKVVFDRAVIPAKAGIHCH